MSGQSQYLADQIREAISKVMPRGGANLGGQLIGGSRGRRASKGAKGAGSLTKWNKTVKKVAREHPKSSFSSVVKMASKEYKKAKPATKRKRAASTKRASSRKR